MTVAVEKVMQPLGTICNTIQFVEPEYKDRITNIMRQASNYSDFVIRLSDFVISEKVSDSLAFVGFYHASINSHHVLGRKIISKYPHSSSMQPWILWETMEEKGWWSWSLLIEEAEEALKQNQNPFIQLELLALKAMCMNTVGEVNTESVIKAMMEIIKNNHQLEWYNSRIESLLSTIYVAEGNFVESLRKLEKALECAFQYNDLQYAATTLIEQSYLLGRNNPSLEAIKQLESAERILLDLGCCSGLYQIPQTKGVIHYSRGEYNAAVDSVLEAIQIRESARSSSQRALPVFLSRIYRGMNYGAESLEWARVALSEAEHPILSHMQKDGFKILAELYIAGALALLGKSKEALQPFDSAKELILKSGNELWIGDMHLISGIMNRSEEKYKEALYDFKRGFEIIERMDRQDRINEYLMRLAETEIILHFSDFSETDRNTDFHWNRRLMERANSRKLPGVLGIALLLEAKIQFLEHKPIKAKSTIKKVRELAKNPEIHYLEEKVDSLIQLAYHDRDSRGLE